MSFVKCGLERLCSLHHVDNIGGSGDVENLHEGVVQRIVRSEQIEISSDEHDQVELLRLD